MQRNTVQRQIILGALRRMKNHPTVEDICAEIQKEHPTISKTTVYRNLRLLAQGEAVRQILLPDDVERYDDNTAGHYHFKCKFCGGIFDIHLEHLDGLLGELSDLVEGEYGYQVDRPVIVFNGTCLQCAEK